MNCARCGASLPAGGGACAACGGLAATMDDTQTGPMDAAPHLPGRFEPGQDFAGRYTVIEAIGEGGMGEVVKALDRKLGRAVALKLIRPRALERASALDRFRRELTLAQRVTHPNVVRVHDLGEIEGALYISMEFVEGQTLEDLIQSMGQLSPRQTLGLARQIAAGLEAVHAQSIVHRDLKPGNVMVDRGGHALVMDFGLAYQKGSERLTRDGAVLGTLAYLSPEQARGLAVDARSDLFALGLMMYEMLAGRRPPGDGAPVPFGVREDVLDCPPPSRFAPDVSAAFDAVVLRCLERDPERRFGSARALIDALLPLGDSSSGSGAVPLRATSTRVPSRPAAWALVGVGIALTLGLGVYLARDAREAERRPGSIALLPLRYDGPAETAYLKDLVPVVLGRALSGATDLRVAPFSVSRGIAPEEPVRATLQQLGVAWVLKGEIAMAGKEVRGRVQLFGAGDEAPRATTQLGGTPEQVIGGIDALAAEIAAQMGQRRPPASAAAAPDTLATYLEGLAFLEGWDREKSAERAEAAFRRAVKADERFAEARAGLAQALWRRYTSDRDARLVEEAGAEARRAVSLGPSLPEAHLALGVVQLGTGRSAEAAASFRRAQELAPADDAVCRRIAAAYASLGRSDEADRLYAQAVELRPGYWENWNDRGAFYVDTGRLADARRMFEEAVRLQPEGVAGLNNLAAVHILDGHPADAEPLLKAAVRLMPTASAHSNLGFVYYALGRFEEAAQQFRLAAEAAPGDFTYHGNLGDALRQLGRKQDANAAYGRAVDLAREALGVNPAQGEIRASLAMSLAGAGRCSEARPEARRAMAEPQPTPTTAYYVAIAEVLCGGRRAALEAARRAIQGGVKADVLTNRDLAPLLSDPELAKLLGPTS